jgi:hypothetical protein
MMDIESLDYSEFELLVGLLLQREGHRILKTPAPPGRLQDADYEVESPDSTLLFVEVKHLRSGVPLALVHRFVHDIERLRASRSDARGLLVVSSELPPRAHEFLKTQPHIAVWDGPPEVPPASAAGSFSNDRKIG